MCDRQELTWHRMAARHPAMCMRALMRKSTANSQMTNRCEFRHVETVVYTLPSAPRELLLTSQP